MAAGHAAELQILRGIFGKFMEFTEMYGNARKFKEMTGGQKKKSMTFTGIFGVFIEFSSGGIVVAAGQAAEHPANPPRDFW